MGAVNFSIDVTLVEFLTQHLAFDCFIETGTFQGATLELAKPYFPHLISIELSEEYYRATALRFQDDPRITILKGDSALVLADVVQQRHDKSLLFWLDAHWCEVEGSEGKLSQCPLLRELQAIHQLNTASVLLIDDARLYLCPPDQPHEYSQWPNFNEVFPALQRLSKQHSLMICNDIIIYYPHSLHGPLQHFAHRHGVNWLDAIVKSREHDRLLQDINGKEQEISTLSRMREEQKQLIHGKEQEISTLSRMCKKQKQLIHGKEQEISTLNRMCKEQRQLLRTQECEIAAKNEVTQTQEHQLVAKEEFIQSQHKELIAKERVIQTLIVFRMSSLHYWLSCLLQYFLKNRFRHHVRSIIRVMRTWLHPKLQQFHQYSAIPLKIPNYYYSAIVSTQRQLPIVSIVTPSFNHAHFLENTINSVLGQNYPNLEYIIQDGGSTDNTSQILECYRSQLTHVESYKDAGQANAINLGFRHATGDIMAWLNSDDLLLPGAISYIVEFFLEHPEVDVVYGHRIMIDEKNQEIGRGILPPHDDTMLFWADYVPQETLFWRRRIWEKTGAYIDESYHFALDWELLLRFHAAGATFVRLPRFVAAFRIHPQQKTSTVLNETGQQEMSRLRKQVHGREVSGDEIRHHIQYYWLKHRIYDRLYWWRVFHY